MNAQAKESFDTLIKQLHDIEGLDYVSIWPLSLASWIVIIIGCLLIALSVYALIYFIAFKRSWRNDTLKKLALLEKNLSQTTARQTVITLSEYLRRIALKRFSRNECAGLNGLEWLEWLKANDSKKFDWVTKGTLFINIPYAPTDSEISPTEIKDLIQAVKDWVR